MCLFDGLRMALPVDFGPLPLQGWVVQHAHVCHPMTEHFNQKSHTICHTINSLFTANNYCICLNIPAQFLRVRMLLLDNTFPLCF